MKPGERQVAPTLSGIRPDHVNRYVWAAERCRDRRVIDFACGVGYGSKLLIDSGATYVLAADRDEEAIGYAKEHYGHCNIHYAVRDSTRLPASLDADLITCFETIEHLEQDIRFLVEARHWAPRLLVSVPNQEGMPFDPKRFNHHFRHYRPHELEDVLARSGWEISERFHQVDRSPGRVEPGWEPGGIHLIADCIRSNG